MLGVFGVVLGALRWRLGPWTAGAYKWGVRAAAGYVLDSQGRYYVVVCLINDARANQGAPAIDALLQWVGEQ